MVTRIGVVFTQCFKVILKQLVPRERGISFGTNVRGWHHDLECSGNKRLPCYHFSCTNFKDHYRMRGSARNIFQEWVNVSTIYKTLHLSQIRKNHVLQKNLKFVLISPYWSQILQKYNKYILLHKDKNWTACVLFDNHRTNASRVSSNLEIKKAK